MTPKQRIQAKAKTLKQEFIAFQSKPGLEDTMKGFFLYDGALEALSNDLILLIFESVSRDNDLLASLYDIPEEEGFTRIAKLIAKTSEEAASNLAQIEPTRQVKFSLLYTSKNPQGDRAITEAAPNDSATPLELSRYS